MPTQSLFYVSNTRDIKEYLLSKVDCSTIAKLASASIKGTRCFSKSLPSIKQELVGWLSSCEETCNYKLDVTIVSFHQVLLYSLNCDCQVQSVSNTENHFFQKYHVKNKNRKKKRKMRSFTRTINCYAMLYFKYVSK